MGHRRAVRGMAAALLCLVLCLAAPGAAAAEEERTAAGTVDSGQDGASVPFEDGGDEAGSGEGTDADAPDGAQDAEEPEDGDGAEGTQEALIPGYNMGGSLVDDHAHQFRLAEEVSPSCEEAGYAVYVCEICGAEQTQVLPALGHDWGEWETARHASLTADGLRYRLCSHDENHVQEQVLPQGVTYELTPADAAIGGANVSVVSLFGVLMFRDLRVLRWDRRLRRQRVPWMKGGG